MTWKNQTNPIKIKAFKLYVDSFLDVDISQASSRTMMLLSPRRDQKRREELKLKICNSFHKKKQPFAHTKGAENRR
uniref:Uncharacterized protein n=1 Tax=Rhizophora mucronata TaxID=61149 RepID=A0A2P2PB85_RHIMU